MKRFSGSFSRGLLALAFFLVVGPALSEGSDDRAGPSVFAGNPQGLVAELRQGILEGLPGDFAAAAKIERGEVVARVQEREAEWEISARFSDP